MGDWVSTMRAKYVARFTGTQPSRTTVARQGVGRWIIPQYRPSAVDNVTDEQPDYLGLLTRRAAEGSLPKDITAFVNKATKAPPGAMSQFRDASGRQLSVRDLLTQMGRERVGDTADLMASNATSVKKTKALNEAIARDRAVAKISKQAVRKLSLSEIRKTRRLNVR
jgi:transketolase